MRIKIPKKKGVTNYTPPVLGEVPNDIVDVSEIISPEETENLNEKLKKLFEYLEPTPNGLIVKGTMKSSNFVRNLKGWGISVNLNGDAYFKTVTAGSYIQVFVQDAVPTSIHINDIWYDSDDDYKQYYAVIAGATTIAAGQWVSANFPTEWADVSDGASTKPSDNADVTGDNQAATIASQGYLATQDTADFDTDVDGAEKPANNATVGATFGTDIAGGGGLNTQVTNAGYATLFRQDKYGGGDDGDVVISVNTSLTTDVFYENLTVNNAVTLNTNGYRIFVKDTLTNNGTIARDGNAGGNGGNGATGTSPPNAGGTAGALGAALADGSISGAIAGVVGKVGAVGQSGAGGTDGNPGVAGDNGVDVNKSLSSADGVTGKDGGTGGNATISLGTKTGGALGSGGGTAGVRTGTVFNAIKNSIAAYLLYDFLPAGEQLKASPSSAGSGSGGAGGAYQDAGAASSGGTGGSGGGGGNAGIVVIFAKTIVNNGTISANGGDGGDAGASGTAFAENSGTTAAGGAGGSGGGNGGSGGILIMVYETLTSNTETANGGAAGAKSSGLVGAAYGVGSSATNGTDGTDGATGNAGVVIKLIS